MEIHWRTKESRHVNTLCQSTAKIYKRARNGSTINSSSLASARSSLLFVLGLSLSIGFIGPLPAANSVFTSGVWSAPIQASVPSTALYWVYDTISDVDLQDGANDKKIDMRWYWCSDSGCTSKRLWTSSSASRPAGLTMLSYSPEPITNFFGHFTIDASEKTIAGSYYFQIRIKTATRDDYSQTQLLTIGSGVMRVVTFLGNTSDGGSTLKQSANTTTVLTANGFTKTGYTFTNWNTAANGSGADYVYDASYSFYSDLTLYAQWSKNSTRTVTYSNGSMTAIGKIPIQSDIAEGSGFIVAENPFTLAGFTFSAWNDGTTNYKPGVFYTVQLNDVVLTAQWSLVTSSKVTFDPNGGVGIIYTQSSSTPTNLNSNAFSRVGYTFAGWSTTPTGPIVYANTERYLFSSSVTIYAQWSANAIHSVSYSAGSTVVTGSAPSKHDVAEGVGFIVAVNTFTRPGYTFAYWISSGSGIAPVNYSVGRTYVMSSSDVTLTAQWNFTADNTVNFTAGEGVGGNYSQAANVPTKLVMNMFTRAGFTFGGWATSMALEPAIAYLDEDIYPFASDTTLYATWNIGTRRSVTYTLAEGTGTVPFQPAIPEDASFIVAEGTGLTKAGFTFRDWSDGILSYAPGSLYVVGKVNIKLTAQWTALGSRSVNYRLNGGTGAVATQSDVVEGRSFTVAARPDIRPGYAFVAWSDNFNSFSPGATYQVLGANVALTAIWSQNVLRTVTYSVGSATVSVANSTLGGDKATPVQADVPEGANFVLAGSDGFSRPGFTFSKWSDGMITFDPGYAYIMGANNALLTAVWMINPSRTVTYNLDGGSGTIPTQPPVVEGLTFRIGSGAGFTREGFAFSSWNNGSLNFAAGASFTASTNNIVLTAVWEKILAATITYNLGGGTGTVPTQPNLSVGATFEVASGSGVTRIGFAFVGWLDGTTSYLPGAAYTVGATNKTLTAAWNAIVLRTITYALGGGSGTIPKQDPSATGSEIEIASASSLSRNGFTFISWSDGKSKIAPSSIYIVPSGKVVLTAQWSSAPTRSIKYVSGGGAGTLPTQEFLPPEGKFIVADGAGITRTGFTFSSWFNGVTNFAPGATYTVGNTNIVLTAVWVVAVPRTITYSLGGGIGRLPIQAPVAIGSTIVVDISSIVTRNGFEFSGWSDGVALLRPGAVYTVGTNNIVFTAQWISMVTHQVNYLAGGAAGTKPASMNIAVGASFVVAAAQGLTKTGSSFLGWSDGSKSYTFGDLYTVGDANVTLVAIWIPAILRTVLYSLSDGTGPLPSHLPVAEGNTFRVSSSAGLSRTGFTFSGWSNGSRTYLPGGSYKMGSSNVVLTAVWTVKK